MKNKSLLIMIIILAGSFFSCLSVLPYSRPLNAKLLKLVNDAVFEVVLEKPVDEPIVYEKEINWDIVPFAVRNDKYHSIGTAFAISKTELITAFHVINDGYDKYYIRDSHGSVYEMDKITGGSNEKDYVIFTVEGKTFDSFFQFEKNYNIGDPVFSIGNALGEGIVIRDGLVLGTVPEEDSGRWNRLKTSANSSPGNSGGPLVTPNGKVIALVTARRDNIIYSTPADVILNDDRSVLLYRSKARLSHLLLPNKLYSIFETQVPLPDTHTNVSRLFREAYIKQYYISMTTLFEEAPEYLSEANNAYLINDSRQSSLRTLSSSDLQISYVDPDDDNWKLSSPYNHKYSLDDDGELYHSKPFFSDINLYKIIKPKSVSLEQICTDPKYIMDIILQNIRTDRTVWYDKYRMLSYGEPASTGLFRDSLGRTWITANWSICFEYQVLIMYILPMPDGPVLITTEQNSASLHEYEWDLQKLCDHLFMVYGASFDKWDDFFALDKYIPDFLRDMRFKWNSNEQTFSLSCGNLSVNADKQVFDWNNKSELFLFPSWYKQNNELEFGIRKVTMHGDKRGKDKIILYRNIKPDPKLGESIIENWNDLILEKFPFNEKPVISSGANTGFMGSIIKARQPYSNVCFSLYLGMDNPQNEEDISRRFNALKEGVFIEK
jgi:hypothetical protein